MKKIFIIIIAMLLPLMASATYINGINYNLSSSAKMATVIGCSSSGNIIIPSQVTYNGVTYNVTSIGRSAFENYSSLTSITIHEGVMSIGEDAFSYCTGLTSITLPKSLNWIDEDAFYGCNKLNAVYISDLEAYLKITFLNDESPSNPLAYAHHLYLNGVEIKDLVIPNTITSIKETALCGGSSLTSVTIPNSVTSIYNRAFLGCSSLKTIVSEIENPFEINPNYIFPDEVLSSAKLIVPAGKKTTYQSTEGWKQFQNIIEVGGFGYGFEADGIRYMVGGNNTVYVVSGKTKYSGDVIIPEKVTYNGVSYTVTTIFPNAFNNCSDLTSVTIPNSVTYIGDEAFLGCSGLTSVTIPSRVTRIGWGAFLCGPLTSILSLNNTPPTCDGTHTFYLNCVLWVPKGCENAYKEADGWKDFQNIRELAFGDVNIDFEVNQADLDATVDFIMGKDPEGFYESLADLNGDDVVDAADVVKLVTILNIQEGLNMEYQAKYSNQVISSLSCTLNNDGDKAIQLTKCELYCNQTLVSSVNFKVTLASGGSKKCSFDELESLSSRTGFSVVWYYTYNEEEYTYRCEITE